MKLEGIHQVTCITGDAPRNVEFYTGVLGLRLVKKTVNQDDPTVYHLFYADEHGSAGSDLTFFEYPGARKGRAGAGMVHRITWRVGSSDSLAFWHGRLENEQVPCERDGETLQFADFEGLRHELVIDESGDPPLVAQHPDIPTEHALRGFDAVRAYASSLHASVAILESALGFEPTGSPGEFEARGQSRGGRYVLEQAPAEPGLSGAGTVHHVAWGTPTDEHEAWQRQTGEAGLRPTPVIDRFYFRSLYFREPGGVLFEIATLGPGFAVDEPADQLGQRLSLPPAFEHLRERLEKVLTPLPQTRTPTHH